MKSDTTQKCLGMRAARLLLAVLCVVALVAIVGFCGKATASPEWTQKSVDGVSYKFGAEIVNGTDTTKAKGTIKTVSGKGMPANSMYIQTYLYTSSKDLVGASKCVANEKGESSVSSSSPKVDTSSKKYRAQAVVRIKSSSGYEKYSSGYSAAHKAPGRSSETSTSGTFETVTFQGVDMTYGSGLQLDADGNQPDLISAVGVSGEEGYVLANNLDCDAEDACNIPVYNLNGDVVDTFVIGE